MEEVSYNIYCDESCHLQNDRQKAMVIGGIKCPTENAREIADTIRYIKCSHGLSRNFEIKWTKVSQAKVSFYEDLIKFFFNSPLLQFRAVVIPDKSKLNHQFFGQSHDDWYYKMYFLLLRALIRKKDKNRVFIDIKDTCSNYKVEQLQEVICNNMRDWDHAALPILQCIRSHESEILQLTDLMIGALSYANRGLHENEGKLQVISTIEKLSCAKLTNKTPLNKKKFNIFIWDAQEV